MIFNSLAPVYKRSSANPNVPTVPFKMLKITYATQRWPVAAAKITTTTTAETLFNEKKSSD